MFAKIFTQIFDSSIREKPEVRFTFMDMLVLADINGVVDMTHEAIAARTNRPLELIRETISDLEGPDPKSRTPDHQGKRLVRLDKHRDWGWMIVNYDRFRQTASEEQRREKTRLRVARFKQKTKQKATGNALVTHGNAGNAMQKQKQKQREKEPYAGVQGGGVVETIKQSLGDLFKRGQCDEWSYAEQCLILEVSRRPEAMSECRELAGLKTKEPKFFPRSIEKLLANWPSVLDRARNYVSSDTKVETLMEKQLREIDRL